MLVLVSLIFGMSGNAYHNKEEGKSFPATCDDEQEEVSISC
jgi:hypothetical protein